MVLKEFSNEERIFFGLNIIEAERKKKKNMGKAEEKRYNEKIEKLKREKEEFLREYKEKLKL